MGGLFCDSKLIGETMNYGIQDNKWFFFVLEGKKCVILHSCFSPLCLFVVVPLWFLHLFLMFSRGFYIYSIGFSSDVHKRLNFFCGCFRGGIEPPQCFEPSLKPFFWWYYVVFVFFQKKFGANIYSKKLQ